MDARERTVLYYLPASGPPAPFGVWRDNLADKRAKAAVAVRVARLASGNFSDSKPIGQGASESRIHFGPGYRLYYGVDGDDIVLLHGGDKSSQSTDIETAMARWHDYKERTNAPKSKLQRRSFRRHSQ